MPQPNMTYLVPVALFLIVIVLLFWSTSIRPQAKATRQHQEVLKNLKVGDKIITTAGIYGRIVALDEKTMTLEVAKDTRIVLLRRMAWNLQD